MSNVYRGTIKELIAQNIKINGEVPSQVEFSMLTRLGEGGFAKKVGVRGPAPGSKGKSSTIWEIDPSVPLVVTSG